MIEDIEEFQPELHLRILCDPCILEHRKVRIVNRWTTERVASKRAESDRVSGGIRDRNLRACRGRKSCRVK